MNRKLLRILIITLVLVLGWMPIKTTFTPVWNGTFANKATHYANASPDGEYLLGTDKKNICLLDGKTGEVIYAKKFKEATRRIISPSYQMVYWDAGILLLLIDKGGKDIIEAVDIKEGKSLWVKDNFKFPKAKKNTSFEDFVIYIPEMKAFAVVTREYMQMLEARTGKELWKTTRLKGTIGSHLYLPEEQELLMVNYSPTWLSGLFKGFKNQFLRMDAKTGRVIWEAVYSGRVKKELATKKPIVKIQKKGNKVLLRLAGLQMFDYKTGQKLWEAVYDQELSKIAWKYARNYPNKDGRLWAAEIYGAIADPLITDKYVYVVVSDRPKGVNKGNEAVRAKWVEKRDAETGKVIWTSEKIKGAKALPEIKLVGDKLILQIGGYVNLQAIYDDGYPVKAGNATIIIYVRQKANKYVWLRKVGLQALDVNTGKIAWKSERFKKQITDILVDNGKIYTASANTFYCFDAKTGNPVYEGDLNAAKVGGGLFAFDRGDNVAIVGSKGMAAFNKKDGSIKWSTEKFRGVESYIKVGDNVFLQNKREDLACVDLNNGEILGIAAVKKAKYRKTAEFAADSPFNGGVDMTEDGNYIFTTNKKKVTKYKVK